MERIGTTPSIRTAAKLLLTMARESELSNARTACTLLHEAGFNTYWVAKCLAHAQEPSGPPPTRLNIASSARRGCRTGQI